MKSITDKDKILNKKCDWLSKFKIIKTVNDPRFDEIIIHKHNTQNIVIFSK